MTNRSGNPDRAAGRPRGGRRADIPDDLIRALHDVLAEKPADAVTLREIAARAGTSAEMVRYYFNGKGGLIAALLDSSIARVRRRLDAMKRQVETADRGHSRLMVECLASIYLDENAGSKLFNSEFVRMRSIDRADEWADRPNAIIEVVYAVVQSLIGRGVYRASLDAEQAAVMLMAVTAHPVRLMETLPTRWISNERLRGAGWLDEVTLLIDRYCLA